MGGCSTAQAQCFVKICGQGKGFLSQSLSFLEFQAGNQMILTGARFFLKHHFGIGPISLAWMTEAFGCRGARLCDEMTCHGLAHNITLVRIDVFPRGLTNRAKTLRRRSVVRRCDTPLAGKCTAPEVPLEWKICGQVKGSLSQPLRMCSICGLSARRPSDFAWGASFQQRCFSRSATFLYGLQMGGSCAPPNPPLWFNMNPYHVL